MSKYNIFYRPNFYLMLFIFLYCLPYLILGNNFIPRMNDTLNGPIPYYSFLAKNNLLFDYSKSIDQIMNGLPRSSFPSGLNVTMLFFLIFNPAWAYILNFILTSFIALFGMYFLMRKVLKQTTEQSTFVHEWIAVIGAICFTALPHYTIMGIGIMGLPLLLVCLLRISANEENMLDYLFFIFFPFYSHLVLNGFFILGYFFLYLITNLLLYKKINKKIVFAAALFFISSVMVDYHLIVQNLATTSFVSHRLEYDKFHTFTFAKVMNDFLLKFLCGHFHYASKPAFIFFLFVVALALGKFISQQHRKIRILSFRIIIFLIMIFFIASFLKWQGWKFLEDYSSFFATFNFDRMVWISPMLWTLLLGLVLFLLAQPIAGKSKLAAKFFMLLIFLIQFFLAITKSSYLDSNPEWIFNVKKVLGLKVKNEISIQSYLAEETFEQIKNFISEPAVSFRTLCIGIDPAVLNYHGFYTLDGYITNYPLAYKKKFREIIAPELIKNKSNLNYFDHWGNRAYVFIASYNRTYRPRFNSAPLKVDLNMTALKNLGGKYIFSAVKLENELALNIKLEKLFQNDGDAWKVYLYKVL